MIYFVCIILIIWGISSKSKNNESSTLKLAPFFGFCFWIIVGALFLFKILFSLCGFMFLIFYICFYQCILSKDKDREEYEESDNYY